MIVSGNELYGTALKACIGSKLPRGVSEDISRAAVVIAQSGIDPTSMLIRTTELPDSEQLQWFFETPNWVCRKGSVSSVGPSLVDFSQLVVGSGYALTKDADCPGLIYGCALSVAETNSLNFEVSFGNEAGEADCEWLIVGSQSTIARIPGEPSNIALKCWGASQGTSVATPIGGLTVNDESWADLKKLAELILVPANEANSADAGAGTTDND